MSRASWKELFKWATIANVLVSLPAVFTAAFSDEPILATTGVLIAVPLFSVFLLMILFAVYDAERRFGTSWQAGLAAVLGFFVLYWLTNFLAENVPIFSAAERAFRTTN